MNQEVLNKHVPGQNGLTIAGYYLLVGEKGIADVGNYITALFLQNEHGKPLWLDRPKEEALTHLQVFIGVLDLIRREGDDLYSPGFRISVRRILNQYESIIGQAYAASVDTLSQEFLDQYKPLKEDWYAFRWTITERLLRREIDELHRPSYKENPPT